MHPARPFEYRDGILHCEDVPLTAVGTAVQTPCYVYSGTAVRKNYQTLKSHFGPLEATVCYAVKANSNLSLLGLLRDEGSSFDIVSGGELYRLRKLGVPPDRILFSGVGKTRAELETAVSLGLFAIVVESVEELELLADVARNRQTDISLRVNPEVDAKTHPYISTGLRQQKFGIDLDQLPSALELLRRCPQLRLVGIGAHIGSQILEVDPYVEAFLRVREVALALRPEHSALRYLDLGGGFGIPYRDEPPFDLEGLAARLAEARGDFRLILEPGRYIVGPAGILLTRIVRHKTNHGKHFIVVDGAMNDLLRPALYGAYHEILPVRQAAPELTADVVGPVCESADFLGRDRALPRLEPDDLLAVMDAGAYGFVASSNYNSRPRAAEVLVEGSGFRTVRRRESYEALLAGEEG